MCAVMALAVAEELKISKSRVARFVEAYIGEFDGVVALNLELRCCTEILSRLRLHTCAAYLRKFSPIEDIATTTSVRRIQTFKFWHCADAL